MPAHHNLHIDTRSIDPPPPTHTRPHLRHLPARGHTRAQVDDVGVCWPGPHGTAEMLVGINFPAPSTTSAARITTHASPVTTGTEAPGNSNVLEDWVVGVLGAGGALAAIGAAVVVCVAVVAFVKFVHSCIRSFIHEFIRSFITTVQQPTEGQGLRKS